MLLKLPLPTTEELISLAIHSPFEDEAVAAILRLLDEEAIEKKDFRHLLLENLEQLHLASPSEQQKQRLRKVITLAALDDPMNRREVLHKSKLQVQEDAAYFESVAQRAKLLLDRL